MAKTIVVYTIRTGTAREMAKRIAECAGAGIYEIEDKVTRKGFLGFMKSGFQASTRKATPIGDPGIDLDPVETIILVQPIWASRVVPPVRTWLQAHAKELSGKRIGLFLVRQGSDPKLVKVDYEREFGSLSAFGSIRDSDDEPSRDKACSSFVSALSK